MATHATRGAVAICSLLLAHSAVVSRRQNKLGTSIHIYIYMYICIHAYSSICILYLATHATRGAVAIRSLSLAHSAVVSNQKLTR